MAHFTVEMRLGSERGPVVFRRFTRRDGFKGLRQAHRWGYEWEGPGALSGRTAVIRPSWVALLDREVVE